MDKETFRRMLAEEQRKARELQESKNQEEKLDIHGDCDYVWAPEKGAATIIYIAVMIFGAIFNARILIWIVATLVYFNFIDKK